MYSGEAPPSFPSARINVSDKGQYRGIQDAGDVYKEPPSYGSMGHGEENSQQHFVNGDLEIPVTGDNPNAPSYTAAGHGQGNSYNSGRNLIGEFTDGGQPPSVSAMARPDVSQTSGDVDRFGTNDKSPGFSDVNRRDTSQTAEASSALEVGPDAQEFVGMSLVGKNFRKFYPNAYYRENDDEN